MPPDRPPELPPWRVVSCPGTIRFERIDKETHTLGRTYAVYRERDGLVWLGQSLAGLMQSIGKHYDLRMHVSSGYRVVRQELKGGAHRGFLVKRLADEREVNALLDRLWPHYVAVVLRHPERWELAPTGELQEENDARARSPLPPP